MNVLQATAQVKIPFEDVDMFNMAWHGNFTKYFESARCALLESIGHTYLHMCENGVMYPVVDLQIKFVKPVAFGRSIDVMATLIEWEHMLKIEYEIHDSLTGEIVARGSSKQAAVVMETMELLRVCPNDLAVKIMAALRKQKYRPSRSRVLGFRRKLK